MNAYLVLGDLLITVYSAYLSIYSRAEGQHCTDNDNEIHSDAQETIRGQTVKSFTPMDQFSPYCDEGLQEKGQLIPAEEQFFSTLKSEIRGMTWLTLQNETFDWCNKSQGNPLILPVQYLVQLL